MGGSIAAVVASVHMKDLQILEKKLKLDQCVASLQ